MFVLSVAVQVVPAHRDAFIAEAVANARATRAGEPGNFRFDLLQHAEDPDRFMLYEVYRDQASFEAHQKTAHYVRWRDTVKDWMATPRQALRYRSLLPESEAAW